MSSLAIIGNIIGAGGGGATYALKGDGAAVYGLAATTQVLASGDTMTVEFANTFDNTSSGTNIFLFTGDGATNDGYIQQRQSDNAIVFNVLTTGGITLDGVPVVNGGTPYPTDGLLHTFVITPNATFEWANILRKYGAVGYSQSAIKSISTNSVARGIETWNFNTQSLTVIEEEGTGSDINLLGVAAEDWVTLPL
jgi:hypothetical protein